MEYLMLYVLLCIFALRQSKSSLFFAYWKVFVKENY